MRRVAALVAVLLLPSIAGAQPGASAVRGAVRTYSEAEVLRLAGLQNVTKSVRWGRVIPYVGTAVAAGSLIYAALDWFYDQAKQSTGTALDDWYDSPGTGVVAARLSITCRYMINSSTYRYGARADVYGPDGEHHSSGNASGGVCSGGQIPLQGESVYEFLRRTAMPLFNAAYSACAGRCYWGAGWRVTGNGNYWEGGSGLVSYQPLDLAELLRTDGQARGAVRARVLPDHLRHLEERPGWPYTYGEPYGPGVGFEVDPAPNINQWYDNPYANPQLDTDGDGWPDWKEVLAGPDPLDSNDYPAYDPAPGQDENQNPLPDRDGDGIPDIYDPCPAQASNKCNDGAEPDPEIEIPDDYMRDATGQAQLDVLRDILDALREQEDPEPDVPAGQPDAPLPQLSPLSEPSLTWTVLEDVASQMESAATAWWADAQTRLPFALGVAWVPAAPSVGAGDCQGVQMTILGQAQEVGLCGTAIDAFLAGPGRAVLLAALLVAFYLASAQVVTRL